MTTAPESLPVRAADSPFAIEVKAGESYYWCACGLSAKQPFCDGSHKGSSFTPVKVSPDKDGKLYFCGCKASAKAPLCDGSHNKA